MRAALRGDRTPLLRLRARAAGLTGTVPTADTTAPACRPSGRREHRPVHRDALQRDELPLDARRPRPARALQQAATRAARRRRAPLRAVRPQRRRCRRASSSCARRGRTRRCRRAALGALPAVPTLVLEGTADLRTPARAGAHGRRARSPARASSPSPAPGTPSSAATSAAAPTPSSPRSPPSTAQHLPARPPRRSARRRGRRCASRRSPAGRRRCARVAAVRATLDDVRRQLIGDAIAAGRSVSTGSRTGGLRGGVATVERRHGRAAARLVRSRRARLRHLRAEARADLAARSSPAPPRRAAGSTIDGTGHRPRRRSAAAASRPPSRPRRRRGAHGRVVAEPRAPRVRAPGAAPRRLSRGQRARPRDLAVPAPARGEPGRLAAVGPGGARPRARARHADPRLDRLLRLPLVPRDGARELRGPGDRRADERALRLHQGRPRGAPRRRRALHGGASRR